MNLKKNMFWIVFGSLMVIGTGLMFFALWKTRTGFVEVKDKLQQAESEYVSLSNGRPYPSDENVVVVQENQEKVETFFESLDALLCEGQSPVETVPGAQFSERLEVVFAGLRNKARQSSVLLPEEFHFGFDVYTEGQLPSDENIPRLMMQLMTVESVCQTFFTHQVADIQSIQREVFEGPGSSFGDMESSMGGRSRGRGVTDAQGSPETVEQRGTDLYKVEGLRIVFSTRDEQLWDLLNALSSQRPFTVVRSMGLVNSATRGADSGIRRRRGADPFRSSEGGMDSFGGPGMMDLEAMGPGMRMDRATSDRRRIPRDGTGTTMALTRDERLVAGRDELVQVDMLLDVYRFCVEEDEDPAVESGMPMDASGSEERL